MIDHHARSEMVKRLQKQVSSIAVQANVSPPRVQLWHRRNARYNAATHVLVVADNLVAGLDDGQLSTLLAHELGHVSRRSRTLKRVIGYMWPPSASWLLACTAAFAIVGFSTTDLSASEPRAWLALLLLGGGGAVSQWLYVRIERRARRDRYAEELFADRFARKHGDPSADIASVLYACARIEGRNDLGAEAHRRIAYDRARRRARRTGHMFGP